MLAVGNLKTCSHCHKTKSIDDYGMDRHAKDNLKSICKSCCKSVYTTRQANWAAEKKRIVFNHYTNNTLACELCGYDVFDVLTLDHIDGDGVEHRKKVNGGASMYHWVIKNNFPENLQVICQNCNWIKYIEQDRPGYCGLAPEVLEYRHTVFERYCDGPIECADCGYKNQLALTVDHINGYGAQHKRDRGGINIYRWLIKNNLPNGFQILCFNCNVLKYRLEGQPTHLIES